MVDFVTVKAEEMKFGDSKFIEVAKKKAVTEEGENTFISLSRGFFTPEGDRRYRKSFSLPLDKDVAEFVSQKILEVFEAGDEDTGKKKKKHKDEESDEE